MNMPTQHWTSREQWDAEWHASIHAWDYADTHYRADIDELRWARKEGYGAYERLGQHYAKAGKGVPHDPERTHGVLQGRYLKRRAQGETEEGYLERVETADYDPLFANTVDSMSALVMENEGTEKIRRAFAGDTRPGLGRIDEADSVAANLWLDIDGKGTNYLTQVQNAACDLSVFAEEWAIVQGPPRGEDGTPVGEASVLLIDPRCVVRTDYDDRGRLIGALVRHFVTVSEGMKGKRYREERFTLYTPEFYQVIRYVQDSEGNTDIVEGPEIGYSGMEVANDERPFYWYATADDARRQDPAGHILPIFRTCMPMKRKAGYLLAQKNNVIFNVESERDNIQRMQCTPAFIFVGVTDEFEEAAQYRKQGYTAYRLNPEYSQSHHYVAPQQGPAEGRSETLKQKKEDFYKAAFRTYENAVARVNVTATEMLQRQRIGENAYLNTLSTALDELENGWLWRLEQVYHPNEPDQWGVANVERDKDFGPMDQEGDTQRRILRYLGGQPLALTEDAEVHMTVKQYQEDGLPVDEDAIREAIRERRDQGAQTGDVFASLRTRRTTAVLNGE